MGETAEDPFTQGLAGHLEIQDIAHESGERSQKSTCMSQCCFEGEPVSDDGLRC